MSIVGYSIQIRPIAVLEYQSLRDTTEWHSLKERQVIEALGHDLFSVVVVWDKQVVAMGRVIGDGAIYFYIQDVIVHPNHQNKGVGKLVMEAIEAYLSKSSNEYAFVGLMASEGAVGFYESFGYKKRKDHSPGMFKIMGMDMRVV